VGPFNEWSDHTPLSFSIRCNNYVPLNKSYTETRYKWDNSFTQQFRSGIIAQLPVFNTLVNNIDCSCKQSVNNIMNSFTDVLRDIADPLFTKQCRFSKTPHYQNNYCTKNADWFDTECTEARSVYLDALRVFNALNTPDSRHDLCTKKLHYKSLLRKKEISVL